MHVQPPNPSGTNVGCFFMSSFLRISTFSGTRLQSTKVRLIGNPLHARSSAQSNIWFKTSDVFPVPVLASIATSPGPHILKSSPIRSAIHCGSFWAFSCTAAHGFASATGEPIGSVSVGASASEVFPTTSICFAGGSSNFIIGAMACRIASALS